MAIRFPGMKKETSCEMFKIPFNIKGFSVLSNAK
jgi:hypothetical protein